MFSFLKDQLWKLEDSILKSKEGLWQSNDDWYIENDKQEETLVRVINRSKSKFLVVDGIHVKESDDEKVWKKGSQDNEGYFALMDLSSQKVLTAVGAHSLEAKGM